MRNSSSTNSSVIHHQVSKIPIILSLRKKIYISYSKKLQQHLILVIFTLIVDKLSWEDLKRLALESDFGLFFLNFGIEIPPVIKFEVDLDNSFISDMVDRSITDLDIFFRADGVKLLSRTFRAASVSNVSGSISGHIYIQPVVRIFKYFSFYFLLLVHRYIRKLFCHTKKLVLPNSHDFCTRTRTCTVSLFYKCF